MWVFLQVNVEIVGNDSSQGSELDQSLWLQQGGGSDGSEPVPETVTVTLTQTPGEGMVKFTISSVVMTIVGRAGGCLILFFF